MTAPDSRRAGGATNEPSFESGVVSALSQHESTRYAAAATGGSRSDRRPGGSDKKTADEKVWRSEDLDLLAVGMGIGDVDGDGKNEIVVIDPTTVYVYRITPEHKLALVCDYSPDGLELKSVDVAQVRKQGNCRIYVSAQNRGSVTSLVLEYRAGALVPVATSVPYFLRILDYPTHGPFLLGQRKGLVKMYDGPILKMVDKGDDVEPQGRFGVPLKIPIFGFAIGDLEGKQKPLIAVYDREDHLRVYEPSGKRLFVSQDYYGGSDVLLKTGGPEVRKDAMRSAIEPDKEFFRPRILAKDLRKNSVYEILAISHASKTKRMLSHTKMLEEGRVVGLTWNGDALVESWATPKIQGMIADFAIESIPGFTGERLITLERKKTDWLAFLRSKSQIRVYDLHALMAEGTQKGSRED
ncbi:MAG: VCBS repeat-containing protein [Desulfomonile tiedjei]|uniref:VCBS repeat-containing protein n=1 Tax=Desulfomonile tiedjei TaxID=2358 RepID=A0A9D6V2V9_9BACT|nr:VCBS repeat-containing protein [Desulfomonile tiedjei]